MSSAFYWHILDTKMRTPPSGRSLHFENVALGGAYTLTTSKQSGALGVHLLSWCSRLLAATYLNNVASSGMIV
jgi:hypothetical protein